MLALAPLLLALPQWPTGPSVGLPLGTDTFDDLAPRVAAAPDGTTWVAWLDLGATTVGDHQLRLQRLTRAGEPTLGPDGLLLFEGPFEFGVDETYDLAAAADGSALVAWLPDGAAPGILLARIAPDGSDPWGGPVAVGSTAGELLDPRVVETADGELAVAWTDDQSLYAQRVSADGAVLWPQDALVADVSAGWATLLDVFAAGDAALLGWHSREGSVARVRVQRLESDGAASFAPGGVDATVGTPGAALVTNFPPLLAPDGQGGLTVGWGEWVRPVAADGTLAWPAATDAFGPGVPFDARIDALQVDPATGDAYALAGDFGGRIRAQKLSPAGQRLWGPDGATVEAGLSGPIGVAINRVEGGVQAVWRSGAPFLTAPELSWRGLDAASGAGLTPTQPYAVMGAQVLEDVTHEVGPTGELVVAWGSDYFFGSLEVHARNLTPNAGQGPAAGAVAVAGAGNPLALTADVGVLGQALELELDLSASGHALGVVFAALGASELPLLGGTLLVDPADPAGELFGLPVASGPLASWSLPVPAGPALLGLGLNVQAAGVDAVVPLALSNGLAVQLGL